MQGLLAHWRAADLIVDQEAARVTNFELDHGLAVFHGHLDRSLVRVSGSGAGQQGGNQKLGDGFGRHGLGPSVVRFVL